MIESEETPETPEDDVAARAEEAATDEPTAPEEDTPGAPAEDAVAEPPSAEDAPAEEALAEDAAPEQPASEEPAADAAPAAPAERRETLHPKEVRRRERSLAGERRPKRTPEERAAERAEERSRKAAARRRYRGRAREKAKAAERVPAPPPAARPEGKRKVRQGIVVSDKADKTITVRIEIARRHRRYEKIVRSTSTLHAHDEANDANVGDTVRVVESRPLSRTKRWQLEEVLERAR